MQYTKRCVANTDEIIKRSQIIINRGKFLTQLLNRNPNKRLGAGPTDSEEIKCHPFFAGTNWDDVYNKKLIAPKPYIKPTELIPVTQITTELMKSYNINPNKVEGWSFAHEI